jgi:hypothetical protein
MKKFNSFGYYVVGNMVVVKLNAKITSAMADMLSLRYTNLVTDYNGKFGFKIEGCLTYSEFWSFKQSLKLAIIDYKIEKLTSEKLHILGVVNVVDKFDDCLDELPI